MQEQFELLKETILSKSDRKVVYYFPNKGNWGDALIRQGTLKFLSDAEIDFVEIKKIDAKTYDNLDKHRLALFGGGGAWCKLWTHPLEIVEKLSRKQNVVIMPSTFEIRPEFENTTYFSRDLYESMQNRPGSYFCHDMAFYLGEDYHPAKQGKGEGHFFRTDHESAGKIQIPKTNLDISTKGKHLSGIRRFFRIVNRFETVFTDRLHVSIAACLLGKKVSIYPGSYFKNLAVYKSSMEGKYEAASFQGDFGFSS